MQLIKIDTIAECNKYFSRKTLHPLICLIDLSETKMCALLKPAFYAVLLNGVSCCSCCGWREYDFSSGTLTFISPDRTLNIDLFRRDENKPCFLLCFLPKLIHGTALNGYFSDYTFFHYRQNEALHLSCNEEEIIKTCMEDIRKELQWCVDEYSQLLLANRLELLLNYSSRFYKRQFITRHDGNKNILVQTDKLLDDYFFSGNAQYKGLPTADYFARMQGFSSAYFEDMLRHETGKDTKEYVLDRQLVIACGQLLRTDKSIAEIAVNLGYSSSRNFCNLFKQVMGYTPTDYRVLN